MPSTARGAAGAATARTAEIGDVRLAYEVHGDAGPWITLLHGGFIGRPTWRSQVPTRTKPNLTMAGRVLSYDQRGYGASTAGDRHGIPAMAADLVGLWDALGIDRSIVVGFSMGSFVALEAAARARDRVPGLVLEGGGTIPDAARAGFSARAEALEGDTTGAVAADSIPRGFSPAFVEAQPEVMAEVVAQASQTDSRTLARTFHALAAWEPSAASLALDCPVLVISGEHDATFPPARGRELADRLPRARHVVVPGAGHTVHVERAPSFNHLVVEFADGVAAGRPPA